jgi:Rod binding domain-containing protein
MTMPLADAPVAAATAVSDGASGRLDAIRRMPPGEARRAAAGELQVMFLTQLLSAMRKTVPESDFLPRSPERNVYEGVFDRAVAEAVAKTDPLGLVRLMGEGPPGLKNPLGSAED